MMGKTYILYMIKAQWRTFASVFQWFCGESFIMSVEKAKTENDVNHYINSCNKSN